MTRRYLSAEQCAARYPRLIRAMLWAAILSDREAAAAIRDHRSGLAWSGEAVNHFGGCLAVILAGINARRRERMMRALFPPHRVA